MTIKFNAFQMWKRIGSIISPKVNTDYLAGNISDAKMMAYLELIMARSAELMGKLTISSVE